MKIGIVTITFNSSDVIEDFLESLVNQTYNEFKVYAIDNASSDNTISILENTKNINLKIIHNDQNIGVAAGNNQGIKLALQEENDLILLLNNDTVFESNLLLKLVKAHLKYGSSIITPKMMYHNSNNMIWYAGGFFDRKKAWLNYHRGQDKIDHNQFAENDVVEYSPTCCALIHKSVFDDIGFMDEKYFVYFDDSDFFYRVCRHGRHEVRYLNEVEFYHKIGSLTKSRKGDQGLKYGDFFIKQMTSNQIYYLRKQKNIYSLLYICFFIFKIQIKFLFSGKYTRDWSTYKLIQKSIFKGLFL